MKYQYIVFDIDGTLIDTKKAIIRSLQDIIYQVDGRKLKDEDCYFCLGITGVETLKRLGIAEEKIPEIMVDWVKILDGYSQWNRPFDGIPELLKSLDEKNYKIGVVTSKSDREYHKDMDQLPFNPYIKAYVTSDETTEHKPTAGPLLKFMEKTGTKPSDILYVGDSTYDSQCAHNAGTDFALALWGAVNPNVPAEFAAPNPKDVEKWLKMQ